MLTHNFAYRHNGPNELEIKKMLETLGINSLDEMMEKLSHLISYEKI